MVTWAQNDILATPETLGEEDYPTERHENDEGSGLSLASPPCGTLPIASPRSSDPPAPSSEAPVEQSVPCRPRSGFSRNGKDQSYALLFNSSIWTHSTASLLVVGTNGQAAHCSRWPSNSGQGATSHRLSLNVDPLREGLALPRSTVARSRKRVSPTCDVPPLPSVRRPCTMGDGTTSFKPSRFPTSSSLAASRVVDSKLAMDLFESWTRGEALPMSIAHRGHAHSASAGSQPKSYHYHKRGSSSLSQHPGLEALVRVGSVKARTSWNGYEGRSANRSDVYHDPEDEGLEAEGDGTSTAPSTCGPITPLSAQFSPIVVKLSPCSHRASVSAANEEDLGRGTAGQILVPDLRPDFVHSDPPHATSHAPASVLTPFVNDDDATFFINPRPAPKPPIADGSADPAPEVLATRALLVTLTSRTPCTPLTPAPGGVTTENSKGSSGNDRVGRRKSLRLRLGHLGLKNLGIRVKTETGRVRLTS